MTMPEATMQPQKSLAQEIVDLLSYSRVNLNPKFLFEAVLSLEQGIPDGLRPLAEHERWRDRRKHDRDIRAYTNELYKEMFREDETLALLARPRTYQVEIFRPTLLHTRPTVGFWFNGELERILEQNDLARVHDFTYNPRGEDVPFYVRVCRLPNEKWLVLTDVRSRSTSQP